MSPKAVFVCPQNDCYICSGRRPRNQNTPRARTQARAGNVAPVCTPRTFEHNVDMAKVKGRTITGLKQRNAVPVDHQFIALERNGAVSWTKDGIEFKQIGAHLGWRDIVDPCDRDLWRSTQQRCAQNRATNAPKSVDKNLHMPPPFAAIAIMTWAVLQGLFTAVLRSDACGADIWATGKAYGLTIKDFRP